MPLLINYSHLWRVSGPLYYFDRGLQRVQPPPAMLARTTAVLALAGAASAFSPMMSMETGRRAVVQAGAAAAIAAPLLRPSPAEAGLSSLSTPGPVGAKSGGGGGGGGKGNKSGAAPVITIFDHRGCQRGGPNKEYTGRKANGQDDEMCVKVSTCRRAPILLLYACTRAYTYTQRGRTPADAYGHHSPAGPVAQDRRLRVPCGSPAR